MKKIVKTRRGVYLDLDASPYEYRGLKFSSAKKLKMFKTRYEAKVEALNKIEDKIYRIVGVTKVFDIYSLADKILLKTYNEMQYK